MCTTYCLLNKSDGKEIGDKRNETTSCLRRCHPTPTWDRNICIWTFWIKIDGFRDLLPISMMAHKPRLLVTEHEDEVQIILSKTSRGNLISREVHVPTAQRSWPTTATDRLEWKEFAIWFLFFNKHYLVIYHKRTSQLQSLAFTFPRGQWCGHWPCTIGPEVLRIENLILEMW